VARHLIENTCSYKLVYGSWDWGRVSNQWVLTDIGVMGLCPAHLAASSLSSGFKLTWK